MVINILVCAEHFLFTPLLLWCFRAFVRSSIVYRRRRTSTLSLSTALRVPAPHSGNSATTPRTIEEGETTADRMDHAVLGISMSMRTIVFLVDVAVAIERLSPQ